MTYQRNDTPEPLASTEKCPECGEPGPHWVSETTVTSGFWTCSKFYGADGRRIDPQNIVKSPLDWL